VHCAACSFSFSSRILRALHAAQEAVNCCGPVLSFSPHPPDLGWSRSHF
jgi:hypothetical protein